MTPVPQSGTRVATPRATAADTRFIHDLAADMAAEHSGLSFVYRALDEVVRRYQLTELIAVVDVPPADRQVFRAGRQPLSQRLPDHARDLACTAAPGLHAEPAVLDPILAAEMIFRSSEEVWAQIAATIQAMVARWHTPGKVDRAFRFMLTSGRAEFLDAVCIKSIDSDKGIQVGRSGAATGKNACTSG